MIFQDRGRPQGNTNKKGQRQGQRQQGQRQGQRQQGDKNNDIYSIHSHYKGGGRWPPLQNRCRGLEGCGTYAVASFVVAMNRVDVVD